MVLVILIALWAIVLVPPYLKDRRESTRTFRATQSGTLPAITSAQRFQPLAMAGPPVRATGSLAGPAVRPVGDARGTRIGAGMPGLHAADNVVQLRPVDDNIVFGAPRGNEQTLQRGLETRSPSRAAAPSSTAAARERRRHVLMVLTGTAFATLLLALGLRGSWIALHVAVDVALVGYVILLVRFRQMAAERSAKVAPIRPPVSEQPVRTLQAAPSYLVRSGT